VCASPALFEEKSRILLRYLKTVSQILSEIQMRGMGVNTSKMLLKKSGRFGIYFVEGGNNQRASNVIYDRKYSTISQSGPEDYSFDSILENCKWLHLPGITPTLSEKAFKSTLETAKVAHSRNITVSCDLNFRKKLWNRVPSKSAKELARECEYVDVIVGNEEDALEVFGINAGCSSVDKSHVEKVLR